MTRSQICFQICPQTRHEIRIMTHSGALMGLAIALVLAGSVAAPVAWAQGIAKESIPGGVEARPSDAAPVPPKAMPAPITPPPAVGGSRPGPALESVQPQPAKPKVVPKDVPATDPPAKDPKAKKAGSKTEPVPLTRSIAPGGLAPAATGPGAPSMPAPLPGNDESKPGAVERLPSAPKQPPQ